jgi:Tfp pilus assembly protein PilN
MAEINLVPIEYRERKERWKKVFSKTTFLVLFLVILSLLLYEATIIYKNKLKISLEGIKQEISLLANKRMPDQEEAIIDLDTKISLLKEVFQNHTYWSEIFERIESLTMSDVYFQDAKLTMELDKISLQFSASTDTYKSLAKQMLVFQEEPIIQRVEISNITLSEEGGIKFGLFSVFPLKTLLFNNNEDKNTKAK